MAGKLLFLLLVSVAGCADAPRPIDDNHVLRDVAGRFHAFFPSDGATDPDPTRDLGLVRPRLGLPELAQAGAPIEIQLLEHGGESPIRAALVARGLDSGGVAHCLAGGPAAAGIAGCYPLALSPPERTAIDGETTLARWQGRTDGTPPGSFDLAIASPIDPPVRMERAVWLSAGDPAAPRPLRVALLADIHVGKGNPAVIEEHLRGVIADLNAARPDLVLVAGDVVNLGDRPELARRARELLLTVDAPLVMVMGNHDHGFGAWMLGEPWGAGWETFGRAFHPLPFFQLTVGGWDFVGFDSGPSTVSPRVLVRGLSPAGVAELDDAIAASGRAGHRGVVLLSHAPTRALLGDHADPASRGVAGRMRDGGAALEASMLAAAARGQRVLHVAGHTHWSDVFEARARPGGLRFERWPTAKMGPCYTPLHGPALVTVQSCTHSGIPGKESARGWGFAWLRLGDGDPAVAFQRYGLAPTDRFALGR